jgi:hypothetical protein
MRTILKDDVILCLLTMILVMMPVSRAKAADTELFIHKSPNFTITVPKDWTKSDSSIDPNNVLRKILDPNETTALEVSVSNLHSGMVYKDMVKILIYFLKDKFQASNCQTLYQREIKLKDSTPAYEFEVKWNHPTILLYTYDLVVFRDKKIISVAVTTPSRVSNQLKQFPLSLTFK